MDVIITDHAYDRAKERLGWNKSAVERMMPKVMDNGSLHKDFSGKMKKWIDKVYLSHKNANNFRIFGGHCFILQGNILITIYDIPHNLIKYV